MHEIPHGDAVQHEKQDLFFQKKASIFAEILNLAIILCFKMLWMQHSNGQSKILVNTGTKFKEKDKA